MAGQRESLLRWFGLESWEYLNKGGDWIRTGEEQVLLRGAYLTPAEQIVALDQEQPVPDTFLKPPY